MINWKKMFSSALTKLFATQVDLEQTKKLDKHYWFSISPAKLIQIINYHINKIFKQINELKFCTNFSFLNQ